MRQIKVKIKYSEAFKQEVVSEIESGRLNFKEARIKYGILGGSTIQYWIKRKGKLELLSKVIRVEKPEEKDRIKDLERQVKVLKEALADTQVKYLISEKQLEIFCREHGLDIEEYKKKLPARPTLKL